MARIITLTKSNLQAVKGSGVRFRGGYMNKGSDPRPPPEFTFS